MSGLLSTVGAPITLNGRTHVERTIYIGSGAVYKRTITIATEMYVGLTESCASSYVSEHADDAGVENIYYEREGDYGGYRVVVETWTYGDWAEEGA